MNVNACQHQRERGRHTAYIHHPHAVLQDSGKEVLQQAISGSEPTCLHIAFCLHSTKQAHPTLIVSAVLFSLFDFQNRAHEHKKNANKADWSSMSVSALMILFELFLVWGLCYVATWLPVGTAMKMFEYNWTESILENQYATLFFGLTVSKS